MDGQFNFGLICGIIAGVVIIAILAILIIIAFNEDPIRSMRIILRGGDDVILELNETHQVSKQIEERHIVQRFKKQNYTVDVHFKADVRGIQYDQ
ncbi:hypothetical protein [Paenibacillus illinoisensis]|uniref:Uncharacterized protein n=1 Tax=Paenibacillus illinoisensis TaxID=59845 RepID=A0A2W0CQ30_9BACL|nr:hypothetical protein [Paenibacillus illinoisensis]PYY29758.1 hypothetical protein PIL02S_01958 [Paenibacillus illinoisensis]